MAQLYYPTTQAVWIVAFLTKNEERRKQGNLNQLQNSTAPLCLVSLKSTDLQGREAGEIVQPCHVLIVEGSTMEFQLKRLNKGQEWKGCRVYIRRNESIFSPSALLDSIVLENKCDRPRGRHFFQTRPHVATEARLGHNLTYTLDFVGPDSRQPQMQVTSYRLRAELVDVFPSQHADMHSPPHSASTCS
jgi:hypothetical protein